MRLESSRSRSARSVRGAVQSSSSYQGKSWICVQFSEGSYQATKGSEDVKLDQVVVFDFEPLRGHGRIEFCLAHTWRFHQHLEQFCSSRTSTSDSSVEGTEACSFADGWYAIEEDFRGPMFNYHTKTRRSELVEIGYVQGTLNSWYPKFRSIKLLPVVPHKAVAEVSKIGNL